MKKRLGILALAFTLALPCCAGNAKAAVLNSSDTGNAVSYTVKKDNAAHTPKVYKAAKKDASKKAKKKKKKYTVNLPKATADFPEFSTEDMKGNEVDNNIFGKYDLTMVHFWGAFCWVCREEMPAVQKIYKKLPKNVNLLGVVIDVSPDMYSDAEESAESLIKDNKVKYKNLKLSYGLEEVIDNFDGVPATVFVNKKGEIVGEPIIGSSERGYVDTLKGMIKGWKY